MKDDGASFDSRFDGNRPFRDTAEAGGISLESALRDFGPAAIDDLIPRIRAVAAVLDAAHAAGTVHGALHPSNVIIADDSTSLIAGKASTVPYVAPEVTDGAAPSPASDQYALAAVTYEWLFGRPIEWPVKRPIEVRGMPGVDRAALSRAFSKALAPAPGDRFDSCGDFCHRLSDAVVPELPLLAFDVDEPPIPNQTVKIGPGFAEEIAMTPDFGALDAYESREEPVTATIVERPAPSSIVAPPPASRYEQARFGGAALILASVVGAIFGFAAGYMARPRALQSAPREMIVTAPGGTEATVAPAPTAPAPQAPAPKALEAPKAPIAAGRLLVRSNPSGASVSVDGVARGVTPLTLTDLGLGRRSIVLTRRGYITETWPVAITRERPSRTLDVRLTAAAAAAATTPVAQGTLVIESRPTGAAVSINGTALGNTPLTISDLAPGEYRIVMSMPAFRNFATTVRVVAGERVRAAASLTAQEQE